MDAADCDIPEVHVIGSNDGLDILNAMVTKKRFRLLCSERAVSSCVPQMLASSVFLDLAVRLVLVAIRLVLVATDSVDFLLVDAAVAVAVAADGLENKVQIPSYCCRVDRRNGRGLFGGTTGLGSSNYQEVKNINIVGHKLHNGR
uniref:Uncharacterized protein n=1 Tax=Ascaris lumbricoides TaxID=6252 RepID=A0A0M3IBB3_ASCLU